MAKDKAVSAAQTWHQIFQFGVYKRNQGRICRQATCGAIWVAAALGAWRLWVTLFQWPTEVRYVAATVLLVIGVWLGFRIVNFPRFADFLIAVEAEMNKVSWPTRAELVRSSVVVIFVIFALAFVLFGFDFVWQLFFSRVLRIGS